MSVFRRPDVAVESRAEIEVDLIKDDRVSGVKAGLVKRIFIAARESSSMSV